MNTAITHPGCNGWAIIDKNQIIGYNPRNYHVAEVKIRTDINGRVYVYINDARETCCTGLNVKTNWSYINYYYTWQINDLRNKLAELQNGETETCGNCAKHFYADPETA